MKLKFYLPVLALLLLASCSSDDEKVEEVSASEQINSIANEMSDDIVTMVQSEGVNAALSLIDLLENSSGIGRISPYQPNESKALMVRKANALAYYFTYGVADILGEEPSDFTEIKGIYEWIPEIEEFEKLEEQSDFLEIRFPVEESTTNNGIFKVSKFEVVQIDFDELPTAIEADLSVDGNPYIDLSFIVDYDSNGNPEVADIDLDVLPFSLDIRFDDTQTTSSVLESSLLLDGKNLVGIDVEVAFDSQFKLEPIAISGEVSYRDLRVVGSFSDTDMDNSENGDPNDYFDLDLYIGADKAGDVVFIFEEIVDGADIYEDYVAYVQYVDGTQEKLEDVLESAIAELEDVFDDL